MAARLQQASEVVDEVRSVARKIERCRAVLRSPLTAAALGVELLPGTVGCLEVLVALVTVVVALFLFGIPYLLALPLITLYRRQYQRQLARLLARLPEIERDVALHALARDSEEALAIVTPALRRLSRPGEVVPSRRPGGRGDELSPDR
jgi:hypothetical protein